MSPPRAALTFSVLLRPAAVQPGERGWLPLLTGVAVAAALRAEAAVPAVLEKWPNDVLIGERKLAGILAEAHGDAIVVGVGLNVTSGPAELAVPTATSLRLEGAAAGREALLEAILAGLAGRYRAWCAAPGAPGWREDYLRWCATVGRRSRRAARRGGSSPAPPWTWTRRAGWWFRPVAGWSRSRAGDVVHVR